MCPLSGRIIRTHKFFIFGVTSSSRVVDVDGHWKWVTPTKATCHSRQEFQPVHESFVTAPSWPDRHRHRQLPMVCLPQRGKLSIYICWPIAAVTAVTSVRHSADSRTSCGDRLECLSPHSHHYRQRTRGVRLDSSRKTTADGRPSTSKRASLG